MVITATPVCQSSAMELPATFLCRQKQWVKADMPDALHTDGSLAWLCHRRKIPLTSSHDESMHPPHLYLLQRSSCCRVPTYPPKPSKYERLNFTLCIKSLFQEKTWKKKIPGLHLLRHPNLGPTRSLRTKRHLPKITRSFSGSQYEGMYTSSNFLNFDPTSSLAQHQGTSLRRFPANSVYTPWPTSKKEETGSRK